MRVFIKKNTPHDEWLNGVCVGVCNYLPHTLSSLLDYQCFPEGVLDQVHNCATFHSCGLTQGWGVGGGGGVLLE